MRKKKQISPHSSLRRAWRQRTETTEAEAENASASRTAFSLSRWNASCCSSAISASTRAATQASQASSSSSSSAVGAMDCACVCVCGGGGGGGGRGKKGKEEQALEGEKRIRFFLREDATRSETCPTRTVFPLPEHRHRFSSSRRADNPALHSFIGRLDVCDIAAREERGRRRGLRRARSQGCTQDACALDALLMLLLRNFVSSFSWSFSHLPVDEFRRRRRRGGHEGRC